jgi:hypothetical protein
VDGIEPPGVMEPAELALTESFLFSPDGEHVATAGRIDQRWRPIVDDAVGPGGVGVGSVRFESDRVSFLVAGQDGAHRVSMQPSARS